MSDSIIEREMEQQDDSCSYCFRSVLSLMPVPMKCHRCGKLIKTEKTENIPSLLNDLLGKRITETKGDSVISWETNY